MTPVTAPRRTRRTSPLRTRHREATRQAILDAAEQVYAEHGFAGGRLERIASQAGVAVGTLYNHFTDRDAIVRALLDAKRAGMLRRVDAGILEAGPGFEPQLRALVGSVFEHLGQHRRLFSLLTQAQPGRGGAGVVALSHGKSPFQRDLAERARRVIEQGQRERRIERGEDAVLLASLLVGLLRAAILEQLERPSPLPGAELSDRLVRLFLHGAQRVPRR